MPAARVQEGSMRSRCKYLCSTVRRKQFLKIITSHVVHTRFVTYPRMHTSFYTRIVIFTGSIVSTRERVHTIPHVHDIIIGSIIYRSLEACGNGTY
jgi:hypothetical protein